MSYIPTIGLEIHAELKTKSKMFCPSPNDPTEARPNVNVCPICLGHPGTLPVPNEEAVKKVIKVGLALNCEIASRSKFDRKNYFYPDLPKGYQISQYDMPLCSKGTLQIGDRTIRITRVHLEEDTGRLIHPEGSKYSLVDFNRAGVPLMELVTEPDIVAGAEARAFAQELQLILRYLEASDADMEKGQMRIEANVSVRKAEQDKLGTKVEVKNMNSFRSLASAIAYEIQRQEQILEDGKKVVQETRGWSEEKQQTVSQREKEEAHDYRYFPEPDIPPMEFTEEDIAQIRRELPELPGQRKKRLTEEYGLTAKEVEFLVANKDLGEFFEQAVSELPPKLEPDELNKRVKLVANYLISDLTGLLKEEEELRVTAEDFAELMEFVVTGSASSAAAKAILKEMVQTGKDPHIIMEEKGLEQVSDESKLEELAQEVVQKNPKAAEDYRQGKEQALQFLVGQLMGLSKGSANPETARQVLARILTKQVG